MNYHPLTGESITIGGYKYVLIPFDEPEKINDDGIIPLIERIIARQFGYTVEKIMARDNTAGVTKARYFLFYFVYKFTSMSAVEIGRRYRRDHATVLYSIKKIKSFVYMKDEYVLPLGVISETILKGVGSLRPPEPVNSEA